MDLDVMPLLFLLCVCYVVKLKCSNVCVFEQLPEVKLQSESTHESAFGVCVCSHLL